MASRPAFTHRPTGEPIDVDGEETQYWTAGLSYCVPFTVTGHPVVVLPLTRSRDGLPIGLQLVGRRWSEPELLGIARQLEELLGPFQRPRGC